MIFFLMVGKRVKDQGRDEWQWGGRDYINGGSHTSSALIEVRSKVFQYRSELGKLADVPIVDVVD